MKTKSEYKKIMENEKELLKKAIKEGCLGWYLRIIKPGLLPK